MKVLLVRHGETTWTAARRLQGNLDVPLSDHGRTQARALAPVIADHAPVRVITSPLARSRETCALLGYQDLREDDRWAEADLGLWTGRYAAELLAEGSRYTQWRAGQFTPPGGEPFSAMTARVVAALDALFDEDCDGTTLVVTHGGPIRAACLHLVGLDPAHVVPVGPASITAIDVEPAAGRSPTSRGRRAGARLRAYNISTRVSRLEAQPVPGHTDLPAGDGQAA